MVLLDVLTFPARYQSGPTPAIPLWTSTTVEPDIATEGFIPLLSYCTLFPHSMVLLDLLPCPTRYQSGPTPAIPLWTSTTVEPEPESEIATEGFIPLLSYCALFPH